MKLKYNGQTVGEVITNRSLNINEVIYSLGYDLATDAEQAYKDGFPGAYLDDVGNYCFDLDGYEMEW